MKSEIEERNESAEGETLLLVGRSRGRFAKTSEWG